jgi:hypothetical protein
MVIITHSVRRIAVLVQPDVTLVRHEPVIRTSAMRNTSGQVVEHLRAAFASPITLFTIIVGS